MISVLPRNPFFYCKIAGDIERYEIFRAMPHRDRTGFFRFFLMLFRVLFLGIEPEPAFCILMKMACRDISFAYPRCRDTDTNMAIPRHFSKLRIVNRPRKSQRTQAIPRAAPDFLCLPVCPTPAFDCILLRSKNAKKRPTIQIIKFCCQGLKFGQKMTWDAETHSRNSLQPSTELLSS